jgi:aconitate hydratase
VTQLINFALLLQLAADYDRLGQGDVIRVEGIHAAIKSGPTIPVKNLTKKLTFVARHGLSDRQVDVYMAGGLINWKKGRL